MPAPPKNLEKDVKKEDVEAEDEAPLQVVEELLGPDVKQIFRAISATGQYMEGFDVQPVDVINDYLRSFMIQGYKMVYVEHVRTVTTVDDIPVGEQMLYVLVKE